MFVHAGGDKQGIEVTLAEVVSQAADQTHYPGIILVSTSSFLM